MAGLRQHFPEFAYAGGQVSQNDLDQYERLTFGNPAVSVTWFGTTSGTASAQALTLVNKLADWPRNPFYQSTGGTPGGTITANFLDQFGVPVTEVVVLGTAAAGTSIYGTAIVAKFLSGTVNTINNNTGTFTVGVGTASNGSAQSNWFGLLTKIGGTNDVKTITWVNNGTPTALNKGTAIGTLVNSTTHAFQGTSGVALTDTYRVILDATYDASSFGTMCAL